MATAISTIHYRFKGDKNYSQVQFEGPVLSVIDLKRAIVQQKKLSIDKGDFDLHIQNDETGQAYIEDGILIHKNVHLTVKRIAARGKQGLRMRLMTKADTSINLDEKSADGTAPAHPDQANPFSIPSRVINAPDGVNVANDPRFTQSRQMGHPSHFTYLCRRCNEPGHHIRDCPTNGNPAFDLQKTTPTTGIPKAFIHKVDESNPAVQPGRGQHSTTALTDQGKVVIVHNEKTWEKTMNTSSATSVALQARRQQEQQLGAVAIPQHCVCHLCQGWLTSASSLPCCHSNFCRECISQHIIKHQSNAKCPVCSASVEMADITPNIRLNAVVHEKRVEMEKAARHTPGAGIPLQSQPQPPAGAPPAHVETAPAPAPVPGPGQPVRHGSHQNNYQQQQYQHQPPQQQQYHQHQQQQQGDAGPMSLPPTNPNNRFVNVKCNNCSQMGHYVTHCRQLLRPDITLTPHQMQLRGEFERKYLTRDLWQYANDSSRSDGGADMPSSVPVQQQQQGGAPPPPPPPSYQQNRYHAGNNPQFNDNPNNQYHNQGYQHQGGGHPQRRFDQHGNNNQHQGGYNRNQKYGNQQHQHNQNKYQHNHHQQPPQQQQQGYRDRDRDYLNNHSNDTHVYYQQQEQANYNYQ